jgi:phage terminase small subunit
MAALPNPKHERFAQELAKGGSQVDAYARAGYSPHDSAAARLFGNVRIQARLAELQERAAIRTEITAADIAEQLEEDRQFARSLNQASAAVSATVAKAKVLGIMVERSQVEQTSKDEREASDAELVHIARGGGDGTAQAPARPH